MTTRPHHAPAFTTTNVSQTDEHQKTQRRVTMKGAFTSTITSLALAMVLTTPALADEPFAQGSGQTADVNSASQLTTSCAMQLWPTSALSVTAATSSAQVQLLSRNQLHLARFGECWRRIGPFATQSTAWERLRQAKSQRFGVSGVFPCHGNYGRGYCFNVFFPC